MSDISFREPLPWAFQEIGFGCNGQIRAQDHLTHKSTNYLFGLFTAVLCSTFGRLFEIRQWPVVTVVSPQEVDLAEILVSVVASSYHQELGLNPSFAGGAAKEAVKGVNQEKWETNWEAARTKIDEKSTMWITNMRLDKEKRQKADGTLNASKVPEYEHERNVEELKMRTETMNKRHRQMDDRFTELVGSLEDSDEDIEDLLKEIPAKRRRLHE